MDYVQHYASPLGGITLASDGQALTGLWFDGQAHFGATLVPGAAQARDLPVFAETARWLALYFSGAQPDFTPPLRLRGTPFQRAVWEALRAIPYGQTLSYGALAARLGSSARAVGGAVGRNPIALIVPCHRGGGARGGLTGYAGGLERKQWLLALEQHKASGF